MVCYCSWSSDWTKGSGMGEMRRSSGLLTRSSYTEHVTYVFASK